MIDCHCHVLPEEVVSDLSILAESDAHFGDLVSTKGARFVSGRTLLEDMATGGVDKAVVFGFAVRDTGLCSLQNDYVLSLARKYPEKIVPLGVISPSSQGFLKEAERCLAKGAAGIGELFPSAHGFSLVGDEMDRLAGLCEEARVPILIHVNEQVGHKYPGKGDVGLVEAFLFASRHPDNVVIFAHLGGGLPLFYSMPEVEGLKNAYFDTAAQPYLFRNSVFRAMRETGALGKIVLGSDYPLLKCERYLQELSKAGLSQDDVRKITLDNPNMVFGSFFPS